ncbi:glycosyltransferase [Hasllibacter sp. MH4015]|uniref:glycosyltransferase n=1 Tax=Hasllibacter sp. MH4015 TaxID=2854029 RepID=UPI001CD53F75|nr:glycosyltransferase [Hasllibacter sp. MH4015]
MGAFSHIPDLWLDVTRLLTRVGRGALTGIDRVELAYLREAYASGCNRYLCRTTRGYLLLDRRGAARLIGMVEGASPMGPADWFSRITFRGNRPRHKAEAALREVAIDRCRPSTLPNLLDRATEAGLTYLNVGHSNLSEATLSAISARSDTRIAVMIHDLIPITHPQYVADGQPENFAGRAERVRTHATHVISNSQATSDSLDRHWADKAAPPHRIVAHLGVDGTPRGSRQARDPSLFVMLGTIEARKNHALILDVWDLLAEELPPGDMPLLHIIGAVGWKVDTFMERLNSHPLMEQKIILNGPDGLLSDSAVRDQLAKAAALLFPSVTEGFGYPPIEAAMAGAVPICSDLPVYRETLGDCAVYVDSGDAYQWKETIKQCLNGTGVMPDLTQLKVPTWQEHFETVVDALTSTLSRTRK